jgi:hypothetical protein
MLLFELLNRPASDHLNSDGIFKIVCSERVLEQCIQFIYQPNAHY